MMEQLGQKLGKAERHLDILEFTHTDIGREHRALSHHHTYD